MVPLRASTMKLVRVTFRDEEERKVANENAQSE